MNLCQKGSHFSFLNPNQQVRAVLLTSGRWFLFSGEKFFCRCLFGFLCGRKYTVQVLFRTLRPLDEKLAVFFNVRSESQLLSLQKHWRSA